MLLSRVLIKTESALGWIAACLLVFLAIIGIIGFFINGAQLFREGISIESPPVTTLLDTVLWVFILIELLRIAIAYVRDTKVVLTVFEAALVAVLRKVILLGTGPLDLNKAAALSVITLSIGLTWFLIERTGKLVE